MKKFILKLLEVIFKYTPTHTCIYCGCETKQPDSLCYKNPNK